ncbi:hypothetical protein LZ30DRAFT_775459 [Colletotrichum cereale]|nr:hypothetical protein LZ30DRAFT_775459 [Colletotrichum cereale]
MTWGSQRLEIRALGEAKNLLGDRTNYSSYVFVTASNSFCTLRGPRSEYFKVAAGRYLQRENQIELVQEEGVRKAAGRFVAKAAGIRKKEVENVDNPDEFLAPNAWVNRLGAARHLQAFGEKKELLRSLISLDYGDESDNPTRCDDGALRVIYMAFKQYTTTTDHQEAGRPTNRPSDRNETD